MGHKVRNVHVSFLPGLLHRHLIIKERHLHDQQPGTEHILHTTGSIQELGGGVAGEGNFGYLGG